MDYKTRFLTSDFIIGHGAIRERITRETDYQIDPYIAQASLVYVPEQREFLKEVYRSYGRLAQAAGVPTIMAAPSKKGTEELIRKYNPAMPDVAADCIRMVREVQAEFGDFGRENIYIGGACGCRGDSYKPEESLTEEEAYRYHRYQIERLEAAKPDYIICETLPAVEEVKGLVRILSEYDIPYVVSFVVRPAGCVLDGTPIDEAIKTLDALVPNNPPLYFNINCVHADFIDEALTNCKDHDILRRRMKGVMCNTAKMTPEELDGSPVLITEEPKPYAEKEFLLHTKWGFKVLGGCCGTDERHIGELLRLLVEYHKHN